jgi:DNA invertase Pin-like site-specific DNA recombinase
MSRGDEIRAQAERIKQAQQQGSEEHRPARRSAPPVRTAPVRRTVDLSPAHHAELVVWCTETARQLGLARVTGQDVLRALVARVLTDETLARKIRADLAERQ